MRPALRASFPLIAVLAILPFAVSAADGVDVREDSGNYAVSAQFEVSQPPERVLAVLTDYERIPRYMPNVRVSEIVSRDGGQVVVRQEAHASVMMFSRTVYLMLDIREGERSLAFADRSRRSFRLYAGEWRVGANTTGSTITYALTARPSFSVPRFVLMRLLRNDASEMIDRLRKEIAAAPAVVE